MGMFKKWLLSLVFCVRFLTHASAFSSNLPVDSLEKIRSIQLQEVILKSDSYEKSRIQIQPTVVLNQKFLNTYQSGSLAETLSQVAGVNHIGIGSSQSSPIIRGLAFNRIVVVEQGIKHQAQQWGADHGLEIDQNSIGEVKLVKGSQSYAYGSDGMGGVVILNPKWNMKSLENQHSLLQADLRYKSNNQSYGTTVSYLTRKENWLFGGIVSRNHYADYRVPTDTVHVYGYPIDLLKNQVRNTAGNDLNLKTEFGYFSSCFKSYQSISYYQQKAGFFANAHGILPVNVDKTIYDASNRDILNPHQSVQHFKILSQNHLSIGKDELEFDLGFQLNNREEFNMYFPHGYMPVQLPQQFDGNEDLERSYKKWVLSGTLRYKHKIQNHDLEYGGNVEYQNNDIGGWGFLIPAYQQISLGAYVQDTYRPNDHVKILGSLRYDAAQIKSELYNDWFSSHSDGENDSLYLRRAERIQRNFNSWVGALGTHISLGDFELRAHFGKSFRLPIAKELASNGVNNHTFSFEVGDSQLKPESAYQFDLGLSYSQNNLHMDVSPFYNYFTNYIYLNPTSEIDYLYGAGHQVYKYTQTFVSQLGLEAVLDWKILPSFTLRSQFDWVQSRQLSGPKKGFSLPFSPSAKLNSEFIWKLNSTQNWGDPFISLQHIWSAKQSQIVPPETPTSAYHIFGLRGGFSYNQLPIPLDFNWQVHNVFNTKYFNHTSYYKMINMPEPGINISLSVSAKIFKPLK